MNRIDRKFSELKKKRKKAFIAYITAGDPSLAKTRGLVFALEAAGVDIVELGVPFSDPLADGPTIQRASQRALSKGANLGSIIRLVKSIRKKSQIPLVLMSYFNPIYRYGLGKFVKDAKAAGSDGAIIPDLPPEEAHAFIKSAKSADFSHIFLLAPTSTRKRTSLVAAKSTGFIYYVSITGVTGARDRLPKDIISHVRDIKRISKKPVCVGFGISNRKQAGLISGVADGVIVGSAVIKVIEKYANKPDMAKKVAEFVSGLVKAVK